MRLDEPEVSTQSGPMKKARASENAQAASKFQEDAITGGLAMHVRSTGDGGEVRVYFSTSGTCIAEVELISAFHQITPLGKIYMVASQQDGSETIKAMCEIHKKR